MKHLVEVGKWDNIYSPDDVLVTPPLSDEFGLALLDKTNGGAYLGVFKSREYTKFREMADFAVKEARGGDVVAWLGGAALPRLGYGDSDGYLHAVEFRSAAQHLVQLEYPGIHLVGLKWPAPGATLTIELSGDPAGMPVFTP